MFKAQNFFASIMLFGLTVTTGMLAFKVYNQENRINSLLITHQKHGLPIANEAKSEAYKKIEEYNKKVKEIEEKYNRLEEQEKQKAKEELRRSLTPLAETIKVYNEANGSDTIAMPTADVPLNEPYGPPAPIQEAGFN